MPKYYVESGEMQMVILASNARDAAVRAFHTYCKRREAVMISSNGDDPRHLPYCEFQETIRVNERGFGRTECDHFDTLDILAS